MRKEKLTNKCLCSISSFYRSSHGRASAKKVFLKILQYSQENTCVEVSLQAFRFAILLIRGINTYGFLRILRNFKEHHFEEHLRTTASYFMNKNRNNSSKKKINKSRDSQSMDFQFRKLAWLQKNCTQI